MTIARKGLPSRHKTMPKTQALGGVDATTCQAGRRSLLLADPKVRAAYLGE